MTYSVDKVRADFPVLSREVNGLPLAYLDSAASAQKPSQVIDAEAEFYRHGYAAVHRGIHTLSAQATEKMENVRKRASLFINARSAEELVFVRGTTEGINLVANSWGNSNVRAGDNIIISQMEHHANIVPWQMLCARVGAELRRSRSIPTVRCNWRRYLRCLMRKLACWQLLMSPTCWERKIRWRK